VAPSRHFDLGPDDEIHERFEEFIEAYGSGKEKA
jgi:hypothetical protein